MQLAFESILTAELRRHLQIYAGYSWGMPTDELDDFLTGVVISPKHAPRASKERRLFETCSNRYCGGRPLEAEVWGDDLVEVDSPLAVMLDNGAYPAYRDGLELSFVDQLDGLLASLELFPDAAWLVAPDVVAEPRRSWARTTQSLATLEPFGLSRVLVPFQNGMSLDHVAGLALELGSGVFVGGTLDWKLQAAARLEARGLYVHVGRVASDAQLAACARHGVSSIDSTSFLRRQHHNVARRRDFLQSFERYARRRPGALDD